MPEFSCRVATLAGEVFERTYAAQDEGALRRDLASQDLMLLDAREQNPLLRGVLRAFRFGGGVPMRDFLFFNQELRALIKAGLPIIPTTNILLERRKNKVFRGVLIDIRDRVKAGEALSDAFAAQGDLFPKLYSASLASGERSGELVAVIERFVAYMQNVLAAEGLESIAGASSARQPHHGRGTRSPERLDESRSPRHWPLQLGPQPHANQRCGNGDCGSLHTTA